MDTRSSSPTFLGHRQQRMRKGNGDCTTAGSVETSSLRVRRPKSDSPTACGTSSQGPERPLECYTPQDYAAVLEGTLLANGNVEGYWRKRSGDSIRNVFRMALMDRGVYDGAFAISSPRSESLRPSMEEIHDAWDSVDWRITTAKSSNVWGRARNVRSGECLLFGSHNPLLNKLVLYKVDESGLRKAQRYAGVSYSSRSYSPDQRRKSVSPIRENAGHKRQRPHGVESEFAAAAALLLRAASGAALEGSNVVAPGNPGVLDASVKMTKGSNVREGLGAPAVAERRFSTPASNTAKSKYPTGKLVRTLPGFSVFNHVGEECFTRDRDGLIGLVARATQMKTEKREIKERAIALRGSLGKARADCEGRVQKAKMDEAALLRAVQELRAKIMDDEKELNVVCEHIKGADEAERRSLEVWHERWTTEVEPFIARCEQGSNSPHQSTSYRRTGQDEIETWKDGKRQDKSRVLRSPFVGPKARSNNG